MHFKEIVSRTIRFQLKKVLKFYGEFTTIEMAIDCEKQLKKWSRAKKEALINGKLELLPDLAKKKFQ
jgi:putative endonuclease